MSAKSAALRLLAAVGVADRLGWPFPRKETTSSSRQSTPSTRWSTSANTPATSPEEGIVREGIVRDDWRKMSEQHADRPEDPDLVAKFLELAKVPKDVICLKQIKLMLNLLRVLRATGLCREEILSILALAAIYFREAIKNNAALSNDQSIGCVLVLYAFLAQSHLIDKAATLKDWHMILLRKEWGLDRVNELIIRLLALRNYVLRVGDGDFKTAMNALRPGSQSRPVADHCKYGMERCGSDGEIIVSV